MKIGRVGAMGWVAALTLLVGGRGALAQTMPPDGSDSVRTVINRNIELTWLGHDAVWLRSPGGQQILINPWLDNPRSPDTLDVRALAQRLRRIDIILVSQGRPEDLGETVAIAKRTRALVVAVPELAEYLRGQGLPASQVQAANTGGTLDLRSVRITLTQAATSPAGPGTSATIGTKHPNAPVYTGAAVGFMLRFENGQTLYYGGPTAFYAGMEHLRALYNPTIALLPIGGRDSMGPMEAAYAAELLDARVVIPIHYGTSPEMTGTPDLFRAEMASRGLNDRLLILQPGEIVK